MGSISGALAAEGEALGVLWVDAHMDLNTPSSSASMNLHGMPLAALLKLGDTQFSEMNAVWSRLQAEVVEGPGLPPSHVSWLGLRDVDEGEAVNFRTLPGALAITMQTIDHEGLAACIRLLEDWIWQTGIKRLWISFDVDSMDPLYAPGTGTAVRGGLTYREGHYLAECLHKTLFTSGSFCTLAGLDVVEVNPLLDRNNETARMAVGWVESLFGRQILREEI
jgi:arginase